MTDRERLIELMRKQFTELYKDGDWNFNEMLVGVADYLLENGVIVPPCKVGDIVYYIFEGEIRELTVISLSYTFSENIKHFNLHTTNYRGAVLSYEIKNIVKTVFLTKEEAEKALKERERE
jgi:uncharacterized protein YqgQ